MNKPTFLKESYDKKQNITSTKCQRIIYLPL